MSRHFNRCLFLNFHPGALNVLKQTTQSRNLCSTARYGGLRARREKRHQKSTVMVAPEFQPERHSQDLGARSGLCAGRSACKTSDYPGETRLLLRRQEFHFFQKLVLNGILPLNFPSPLRSTCALLVSQSPAVPNLTHTNPNKREKKSPDRR